jgi:predicted nucleic acid-binding protein
MPARVRVFLDISALFAGVWSAEGGGRMILKLGEVEAVDLLVSPQVLAEAEGAVRRKAPAALGLLAVFLDRSRLEVTPAPASQTVQTCRALTGHDGDAQVLAAAWEVEPNYFVTLDRAHFLDNPVLRAAVPFPLGTPGDFLAWYRARLAAELQ